MIDARPMLGQRPLGDVLWPGLEKHYAHLHPGAVAALFALAEARYDTPAGYHAPPPLVPMVHFGRSPAEVPLKTLIAFSTEYADDTTKEIDPERVPRDGLPAYARLAQDLDDAAVCHCGLILLRKLVSTVKRAPAVSAVVATGIVPHLVRRLYNDDGDAQLKTEVLWLLTELTLGGHARDVVAANFIEAVVRCARATLDQNVAEQAVRALDALAEQSVLYRDFSIGLGGQSLHSMIEHFPTNATVIERCLGAFPGHLINAPPTALNVLLPFLSECVCQLLRHDDPQVRCAAVLTLMNDLSDGPGARSATLVPALPTLVQMVEDPESPLALPALMTIANMVEYHSTAALEHGVLALFAKLMVREDSASRKEACRMLCNLAACGEEEIQAIIDAGIVPVLLRELEVEEPEPGVLKGVILAFSHMVSGCPEQIDFLVTAGLLPVLISCLAKSTSAPLLLESILTTLEDAFRHCEGTQTNWKTCVIERGGVAALRTAARTFRPNLARKAGDLLNKHFVDEAEE